MKPTLQPGVSRVSRIVIDRERTISFMGEEARVYATPAMSALRSRSSIWRRRCRA